MSKKNKNSPNRSNNNQNQSNHNTPVNKATPEIPDYSPHSQTNKPEINRSHGDFKN